jgi:glycosyltransferase involved in cell wall biosynthesis
MTQERRIMRHYIRLFDFSQKVDYRTEVLSGLTVALALIPGRVDQETRYALYTHCDAFLFQSLAEGFGMPVIEAMIAGAPVIANDGTSLREVGGVAAGYFTSFDHVRMAAAVRGHLQSFHADAAASTARGRANAQRFNWEQCARSYLDLYRRIALR